MCINIDIHNTINDITVKQWNNILFELYKFHYFAFFSTRIDIGPEKSNLSSIKIQNDKMSY